MIAYQLKSNGVWTGATIQVSQTAGLAPGWVRAPAPPNLSGGQCAVFVGDGWVIQATEPPLLGLLTPTTSQGVGYVPNYPGDPDRTLAAVQAALNSGGVINLVPDASYAGGYGTVKITKPVRIIGNGASFVDLYVGGRNSTVDRAYFHGVKFETRKTPSKSQLPPYAINVRNVDFLSLIDCEFDGVLAYIASDDQMAHYGPTIRDCEFRIDGTAWAWETLQLDQLTIDGYRHPTIENNKFFARNVNRVLKVSVGLTVPETPEGSPVPTYNARALTFRGNAVIGSCELINGLPGGKQVIDCFAGTTESTFSDNYFLCYGFNRCIENKTGYAYADSNIVTSHKILNNRFYLDCAAVFFQGAYGLTTYTPNSRDTLHLDGNTYRITGDKAGTVHARFIHLLTVGAGDDASVVGTVADKIHYDISSCEEIKILGANARGGTVLVGNATSNAQADSFAAPVRRITMSGVSVLDWGASQTFETAAITVRDCTGLESVSFSGCHSISQYDNVNMGSALWLKNCGAVPKVIIRGNVAHHTSNPAKEFFRRTATTVTKLVEDGNTWTPAA